MSLEFLEVQSTETFCFMLEWVRFPNLHVCSEMNSWVPVRFEKMLCQDSDDLVETLQLLFANISNQLPGSHGWM